MLRAVPTSGYESLPAAGARCAGCDRTLEWFGAMADFAKETGKLIRDLLRERDHRLKPLEMRVAELEA